jgi:ribosomal protein S14
MDFDDQIKTQHLFMENRVCRVCGVEKSLLADFYMCRKDPTLRSSYSYECKICARKRVLSNYYKDSLDTCITCGDKEVKVVKGACKKCRRVMRQVSRQTLLNMIEYLGEDEEITKLD